jgi:hypothetical protein
MTPITIIEESGYLYLKDDKIKYKITKHNVNEFFLNNILHIAANLVDVEICKKLIEFGIDTSRKDLYGNNALHTISNISNSYGGEYFIDKCKQIILLLLYNGCDMYLKNNYGSYPVDLVTPKLRIVMLITLFI